MKAKKDKKQKTLTLPQRIKEVESQIKANSKDAEFASKLISKLRTLQKEQDLNGVELIIPAKTITDTIDFGATKIQRCAQGFLFTAKGGVQTLISWRMQAVCEMIQTLFDFRDNPAQNEEQQRLQEIHRSAVLYVLQSPIFASLSEISLIEIATKIIETFNNAVTEGVDKAEEREETEEDVKANIAAEREIAAVEHLLKEAENLPDYDGDDERGE